MQGFMFVSLRNHAQHAVSQSSTDFPNKLPLPGPLNRRRESPREANTERKKNMFIQIRDNKKAAALKQTEAVCCFSDTHQIRFLQQTEQHN